MNQLFRFGIIGIILISLPVTVFVMQQNQDIRQRAKEQPRECTNGSYERRCKGTSGCNYTVKKCEDGEWIEKLHETNCKLAPNGCRVKCGDSIDDCAEGNPSGTRDGNTSWMCYQNGGLPISFINCSISPTPTPTPSPVTPKPTLVTTTSINCYVCNNYKWYLRSGIGSCSDISTTDESKKCKKDYRVNDICWSNMNIAEKECESSPATPTASPNNPTSNPDSCSLNGTTVSGYKNNIRYSRADTCQSNTLTNYSCTGTQLAATSSLCFDCGYGVCKTQISPVPTSTLTPTPTRDYPWFDQKYYVNYLSNANPFYISWNNVQGYVTQVREGTKIYKLEITNITGAINYKNIQYATNSSVLFNCVRGKNYKLKISICNNNSTDSPCIVGGEGDTSYIGCEPTRADCSLYDGNRTACNSNYGESYVDYSNASQPIWGCRSYMDYPCARSCWPLTASNSDACPAILNTIAPTPIPTSCIKSKSKGNADGNCIININDYRIWFQNFTGIITNNSADFNNDGTTDIVDYNIYRNNFYELLPL